MALIYGSGDPQRSSEISRNVKAGKLRKLATKLYTDDLRTEPAEIIRRHRLDFSGNETAVRPLPDGSSGVFGSDGHEWRAATEGSA